MRVMYERDYIKWGKNQTTSFIELIALTNDRRKLQRQIYNLK
jgi:hypothetical protein